MVSPDRTDTGRPGVPKGMLGETSLLTAGWESWMFLEGVCSNKNLISQHNQCEISFFRSLEPNSEIAVSLRTYIPLPKLSMGLRELASTLRNRGPKDFDSEALIAKPKLVEL